MELDTERLMRILPHRWPFVLLDRVTDLAPRESARGVKCVTASEHCFQGNLTGRPVFPSVLVLESMSQLLAVLAYASEPFDTHRRFLYFLGFDGVKFRRAVTPGDRMILDVEITQHRSNIWKARARATVDGNLCAQADLLAAVTDRDEA